MIAHKPVVRETFAWAGFTPEAVLSEALHRFRSRLLDSCDTDALEDAEALCGEVIEKCGNVFVPTAGELIVHVDSCNEEVAWLSRQPIPAGTWSRAIATGDQLLLYCLTAGAPLVTPEISADPVISAATHFLGLEVLYALGRAYDAALKQNEGPQWTKLALLSSSPLNGRCQWDPRLVHAIFESFAGSEAPVKLLESGSFSPVHTVVGICRHRKWNA